MIGAIKNIFILCCLILSVALLAMFLIQIPWVFKQALKVTIAKEVKGYKIIDLDFTDHSLEFFKFVSISGFKIVVQNEHGDQWQFRSRDLNLRCDNLLGKDINKTVSVEFEEASLKSKKGVAVTDVSFTGDMHLKDKKLSHIKGTLTVGEVVAHELVVNDLKTYVLATQGELHLQDIWARFYEGIIKGEIIVANKKHLPYNIDMQFVGVDFGSLSMSQFDLSSKIQGIYDGFIHIVGSQQKIKTVTGSVDATQLAFIHSSLLAFHFQFLPETIVSSLNNITAEKSFIPMEEISISFTNKSNSLMYVESKLASQKHNLDLNIDYDINLNRSLTDLFNKWRKH
ncbi:MAG: hypothetical protein ACI9F2_000513 [Lysobacterales bacterium]|jgi:hypothetical protein